MKSLFLLAVAGLVSLTACGGEDGSPGGAGGSGGGTAGSGGTSGASDCNALVNDGADIPETAQTGALPTLTGGSVADGTYVLTTRQDWEGSCGCTSRQKLMISGSKVELVARTDSGPDQHISATATLTGNQLSLAVDCPGVTSQQFTYSATATELQIFDAEDQSLDIYTKQ